MSDDGPDDRDLERADARPLWPVAILLLACAGVLGWQALTWARYEGSVARSDEVVAQVDAAASLLAERESSLHGLLVSGAQGFRERYRSADSALDGELRRLGELLVESQEERASAVRLGELDRAWRGSATDALGGRGTRAAGPDAVLARQAVMDGVRAELRTLRERHLRSRGAAIDGARRASLFVIASSIALALLAAVELVLFVRRRKNGPAGAAARRSAELHDSEERFRLYVEGVRGAAVYMLDAEGRVRSWNEGAERIKGYPPEEVLGRNVSMFYPREDLVEGHVQRELAEAAARGQLDTEGWRVRRDGSRFWAAVTLRALRGAGGRVVGYAKLVRDTTDGRRLERSRAAQFAVARTLSEARSFGEALPRLLGELARALAYDAALAWSLEEEEAAGSSAPAAPGSPVTSAGALRVVASWSRPGSRGEAFLREVGPLRLDPGAGTPWKVAASAAPEWLEDAAREPGPTPGPEAARAGLRSSLSFPVVSEGGTPFVLQLFSIDPRPRDDELVELVSALTLTIGSSLERERLAKRLLERERLHARELEERAGDRSGELLDLSSSAEPFGASTVQELRAPLDLLRAGLRALLDGDPSVAAGGRQSAADLEPAGRARLVHLELEAQRMSQLLETFSQLSRVSRGELKSQPFDLSAVFREVVAEVRRLHPDTSVELSVEEGVRARGDPRLVRAGLVCLVSSSLRLSPPEPLRRFELHATAGGEEPVYHVRDSGGGVDLAYSEMLAKPPRPDRLGSELDRARAGLATWQWIVERHGGRMWAGGSVEAFPDAGGGICFTLGESR